MSNLGHDRHRPDDSDGMISIWDLASRKQVGESLVGHPRSRLTFSPDGNILATTNRTHGTVLWNLATRRPLGRPLGQAKYGIAFSPDGKLLAAGGRGEGIIRFWDTVTLQKTGPPVPDRVRHADQARGRGNAVSEDPPAARTATGDPRASVRQ